VDPDTLVDWDLIEQVVNHADLNNIIMRINLLIL
jgi:hypothetical protein